MGLKGEGFIDVMNLKCEPEMIDLLRMSKGYLPAYHMNKSHWITVLLDGMVSFDNIKPLIDGSYALTADKKNKKKPEARVGKLYRKVWERNRNNHTGYADVWYDFLRVGGVEIKMKIRLMTIADYDPVYSLWLNTSGMGLNNMDDTQEGIERFLKRNPNTCFVAEDEGKIVGVILSGHDGRRGYIYHTAVSKVYRGQGIGQKLVDAVFHALAEEGISKAALVVFDTNERGNAFWERMGFGCRTDLVYRDKMICELERIDI